MSDILEQHRKKYEEMRLAAMIWWLILWYASNEGELEIPSEHEWLICELAATLIEEATAKQFWYSWQHDDANHECTQEWDVWPDRLNTELDRCAQYNPMKFDGWDFDSRLRKYLKQFVQQTFQCAHSEKWFISRLRWFHEEYSTTQVTINRARARFTPHYEMYRRAIDELPRHTFEQYEDACEWCRRLGIIMRKYIERDIAYIKAHYSW